MADMTDFKDTAGAKAGKLRGHLLAAGAILVWGTTFITSKELLQVFSTTQVIAVRFLLAYLTMLLLDHRRHKTSLRDELLFLLLGATGTTLYFLFENGALMVTYASHVSILLSAAPIFTALLAHCFTRDEKITAFLLAGSLISFAGVALVVFNGNVVLGLKPVGDLLCMGAALSWAVYSVALKRGLARFDSLFLTRRTVFYGLLTSLPLLLAEHRSVPWAAFLHPGVVAGFLFLGVLGSGLCYAVWNVAAKSLGIVATNNYIYLSPFVTMVAAALLLGEPVTPMGVAGTLLILGGIAAAGYKKRPA